MKYGVSTRCITPKWPVYMAGYAIRKTRCEGIHDDLYAKTVLLNDGEKSVLLISCDVISLRRNWTDMIKEEIQKKHGFERDAILIQTTHTHSSVEIANVSDEADLSPEQRYANFLKEKIMESVEEAIQYQNEGAVEYGSASTHVGINRRRKTADGIILGYNPGGPIDRKLSVMQIKDEQGQPRVILFNVACHATVLRGSNMLISADHPGVACREIEERNPGCTAIFMQGACGDIDPRVCDYGGERFKSDTDFDDVEIAGRTLAHDVNYISRHMETMPELKIKSALEDISLPYDIKDKPYLEKLAMKYDDNNPWHTGWSGKVKKIIEKLEEETYETGHPFYVQSIELAPGFRIVSLEGEMFCEIGLKIKEQFPGDFTMIAGYANGCIGYVPTGAAIAEGGYEVADVFVYGGRPGPFSSEAEVVIAETAKKLASK